MQIQVHTDHNIEGREATATTSAKWWRAPSVDSATGSRGWKST